MKTTYLHLIKVAILIIGVVYALSVIATDETVILIVIVAISTLFKFIVKATLYIIFRVITWIAIITLIGMILTTI